MENFWCYSDGIPMILSECDYFPNKIENCSPDGGLKSGKSYIYLRIGQLLTINKSEVSSIPPGV